MKKERN